MSQGSSDSAPEHSPVEKPRRPLPPAPVADLIGFEITSGADGRAVMTLQAGPQHANPMGTLHGGILCDIGDAAMGYAFASTLAEGETFTTIDLRANFFRPVWNAVLRAEAIVVHRGRTVGYVECDVTDEKGRVVAKLSSTCMVLRLDKAAGR
ncbi:MAG TPA: PaaI family thioesterase [Planctomycetaceae bacterium]|nr:PaaI family thioesterase [Planctomycetaceae bacterium]